MGGHALQRRRRGYIQYSPDVFQDDGEVTNDSTREFLTAYMTEFRAYIGMVLTVLPRPPQEQGDETSDKPVEDH